MMDWYNGLDTEDFVVPKDEELVDVFPSEDSWQQWGMSGSQNFGWPMKFEGLKKGDPRDDKTVFGKATAQESESYSMTGGWPSDHWCENTTDQDRPDYHFHDLMQNNQMDDIFLSSLLKEDPTASENNDVKSSLLSSETQFSSGSADGDSESLVFDFQRAMQSRESLQNFETEHVGTSSSMGINDHHLTKKRSNGANGSSYCTGEEVSVEEAVLNDLGETLTHLSTNTRLCFRDSLYRLAQNSTKHALLSGQAQDPSPYELEVGSSHTRSGETTKAESETNTIDRAVANFVFKKVDANTQDLRPVISPMKRKCEGVDENKATKYISFSPPQIFEYPPA